jgi:hypothetical protein
LAPSLKLKYRSTHLNSWLGTGWDLRVGAIERDFLRGIDFTGDAYVLDDGAGRTALVGTGGGRYAPRIEHSFFRIRKLTSEDSRFYWEVTSKDGTQYQYGRTAEARMDDPADANHIFSWNLETVRDVQGNTIKYQYEKTSTPAREIYLKRIFYASNGT